MSVKLIIQMPVFNEEHSIKTVLKDFPCHIDGIDSIETVIINDGSTDKTVEKAKHGGVKHIVDNPQRLGLGRAFIEGLKYAYNIGADIIVNTDADGQYLGSEIYKIIKPIQDNKADIVIGDRQLSKISGYPIHKLISQSIGNLIVSKLFRINAKDVTSGFRAVSKEAASILIKELGNDYTYTLESICLLASEKKRLSFVPVDICYPTRRSRLITSKLYYVSNFFVTLIKQYIFFVLNKKFRFFQNGKQKICLLESTRLH